MGQRVIYVMTHDSIGLGEDGPTHQPVEHLASLRAMPNLNVFRPADPVETAECWELALEAAAHAVDPGADAPGGAACCAPRRGARTGRAKGAYVLAEAEGGKRDVTILATGSEVGIAMDARELLGQGRHPGRGGVDALLGTVRGAARCLSRGGAGLGARASASRLASALAGSAGWATEASSSAWTASVRRRPRRSSTSISASRRPRLPKLQRIL